MITRETCRMIKLLLLHHLENVIDCVCIEDTKMTSKCAGDILLIEPRTTLCYSTDVCSDSVQFAHNEHAAEPYRVLGGIGFEPTSAQYNDPEFFKPYEHDDILYGTEFSLDHDSTYFQKSLLFTGPMDVFDCLVLRTYIEPELQYIHGHLSLNFFKNEAGDLFDESKVLEVCREFGLDEKRIGHI